MFSVNKKRVRLLKKSRNQIKKYNKAIISPIIYWMSRDQRIDDNWALLFVTELSILYKVPIIIVFNIVNKFLEANLRHYDFMIDGIIRTKHIAETLNIPFLILIGDPEINIPEIANLLNASAIVTDFDPLKIKKDWKNKVINKINIDFYEVDAHNIIPCWITSEKQEYSAYTIRLRIKKQLDEFLEEFPRISNYSKYIFLNLINYHKNYKIFNVGSKNKNNKSKKLSSELILEDIYNKIYSKFSDLYYNPTNKIIGEIISKTRSNPNNNNFLKQVLINQLKLSSKIKPTNFYKSGPAEAYKVLDEFINFKIGKYSLERNNPNKDFQSGLSPYIHFGQISSQRIALEISKLDLDNASRESKNAFLEELIVRKELSENFCNYNLNYDNIEGFPEWAKVTLDNHRADKRNYIYNYEDFEYAETHDDLWNASQLEMVKKGKMHGYMRMYWAKKILEWTKHPEEALEYAISLNDKYEIDGRDPNGYTGIAWSIGGVHDRAWKERKIFGKIRYMSYEGCKKKFDIKKYINKIKNL